MLALAQPLMWAGMGSLGWLVAAIVVYFIGFNLLEATMPSLGLDRGVRPMGLWSMSTTLSRCCNPSKLS